jgi:hypothetical protein
MHRRDPAIPVGHALRSSAAHGGLGRRKY